MPVLDPRDSLTSDTRGVSEIVGFILLFGIVILLISINQAQIVPQENAEIEFKHSQDVRNDLVELQSSLSEAGQADVSQYSTVELGMYYPTRVVAINPPPPTGRLETSDTYNITITNKSESLDTGTTENVSTRFLKYTPGYHEFNSSPTWYENSILYMDAQDDAVIFEDDHLGIDDGVVTLTALQNEFEESETGRVTIEAHTVENESKIKEVPTGDLTIRLPTRLTGKEYWHQYNSTSVYRGIDEDGGIYEDEEGNVSEVKLNVDTSTESNKFKINTVGLQSKPSDDKTYLKKNVGVSNNTYTPRERSFEFKSYDAERNGNDVTFDFEVSAGSADLDRVSVEVVQTSSGKVRDDKLYPDPDPRKYSNNGKLAIGTGGGAEVKFIAEDENGRIIQETINV